MDILGIGNALLDIFCFSDDETALSLGLHSNHAAHVSPNRFDELLLAIREPIFVSGGSASNAVKAASALGAQSAFIGCTGSEERERDRWAQLFEEDLASYGVHCLLETRNTVTGRCLVIHMPGTLKAIACAPGAASGLRLEQFENGDISRAKIVFVDGQVLRNKAVMSAIARQCREEAIPLALDISSTDIARNCALEINELLSHNDTILFMNSAEALAFGRSIKNTLAVDEDYHSEGSLLDTIFSFYTEKKQFFPCIIEKRGENGAITWSGGEKHEAKTKQIEHILDDTGAGDVFAGAFLSAYLHSLPIPDALAFANSAAREVLLTPGTRLDRDTFSQLKDDLLSKK